ncbi:hemolysin family protein [Aestuariivirga litoralis]|uniref:hemolysin family protein n=1 Tax=Aestuariivirga litoralis TaxID=2650924 RepID=UPI0018C7A928|nr:hemolysin family protein [Aestuariivirga litoralis]MBG1231463.1 HlyC/CorC family transporter [Aestuariivirga litoralis]
MIFDIAIIVFLILLNGVFAMTELAVVSSRRSRLVARAQAGNRATKIALDLKDDPGKFLSTVQIGITLIGIFSGAFSGVTLAEPLGAYFLSLNPDLGTRADDIAIAIVVTGVTYLSLVIGELVPKQIALRHADTVATAIAMPIYWLSLITRPVVAVLDFSNRAVLALLRIKTDEPNSVSEEDVKAAIAEGAAGGALEPAERQIMDRVMRLDDISVTAAMTHRKDIVWLDVKEPKASVLRKVREFRHSRYPLMDKTPDKILGIVVVKDMLLRQSAAKFDLRSMVHKPIYLPESRSVLETLEAFKQSSSNMALIVDEYGALQGLITMKDIMEFIVGVLPEPAHREDYSAVQREDGSWLADGGLSTHEMQDLTGISGMADGTDDFTTLAGFMLSKLGYIPKAGDHITWNNWRFEVVDMDRTRIDKILISPVVSS